MSYFISVLKRRLPVCIAFAVGLEGHGAPFMCQTSSSNPWRCVQISKPTLPFLGMGSKCKVFLKLGGEFCKCVSKGGLLAVLPVQ